VATKKDLVEAHAFSRRRLVTAFVSGAPGGREVEPTRPGRALAAGLAVAVLVLAGAAVYGVLASPSTVDWSAEGLVSERETGVDYLVLRTADPDDGDATEVRPVANHTSALLVLGADVEATVAAREEIAERPRGAPIGIAGAPESPPDVGALVPSRWTACSGVAGEDPTGVRVQVSSSPGAVGVPDGFLLLRPETGGLRLVVPDGDGGAVGLDVADGSSADVVLDRVVGVTQAAAVTVPDAFADLFPAGAALDLASFDLTRADLDDPWPGRERSDDRGLAAAAEVGDLLEVDGTTYLATATGLRRLTPFERSAWRGLTAAETRTFEGLGALPDVPLEEMPATSWPDALPDGAAVVDGPACAVLLTGGEGADEPRVTVATTGAGGPASADGVALDDVARTVDPGAGALVRPAGDDAAPVLVDDRGVASPLGTGDEQDRLGYAGVAPATVPEAWLALFAAGDPLTVESARCPTGSCDPDA
jgi:hypothetical protein